jgi:hypothetical protein
MRWFSVAFALVLGTACDTAGADYVGHPDGYHQDQGVTFDLQTSENPAATTVQETAGMMWPHTAWTWRGNFTVDESTTNANGDIEGAWIGMEQTQVVVGAETACLLTWTTNENRALEGDEACADCSKSWDVTCDQGHVEEGDSCDSYFYPEYYETPMAFGMAFKATGEPDSDGVTPGVVMFNNPEYPGWYEGAYATFDGHTMEYELTVTD